MDYAQINHTDCSLLWNLKMCLGTFPEYSRTMQPLPNHHWQYPAFSGHDKYSSFDSSPALQTYQFPYCFIAFYPSAISILAVLWNSFLTFLSLFFLLFPFIGWVFKWFFTVGLFLLVDLKLLKLFHLYQASYGLQNMTSITQPDISEFLEHISVRHDGEECPSTAHTWRINTQFLLSVQKHLGVQSPGKNKHPLPKRWEAQANLWSTDHPTREGSGGHVFHRADKQHPCAVVAMKFCNQPYS